MRLYVINDLKENQMARVASALRDRGMASSMDGLFWVELPENMLTDEQKDHLQECGPYCMGLELLGETGHENRLPGSHGPMVALELLVRARSTLRCSCIAYATPEQRSYAIEFTDKLMRELDIQA
jgi:hypothetical protein